MADPVNPQEYGLIESSESDVSAELFAEVESDYHSSKDDEVSFACHGTVIEADPANITIQREFWSKCAIGFIWTTGSSLSVISNTSLMLHGELEVRPMGSGWCSVCTKKWRPNLVLEILQLNFVSLWVYLHGLTLEYQYPELAERMGHLMGTCEQVDWEDRMPLNIRFMRFQGTNQPLDACGFDDGSKIWIKCNHNNPNTPFNSPTSSPPYSVPKIGNPSHTTTPHNNDHTPSPHRTPGITFSLRPPWFPPKSSALRWAWIDGSGPFVTNG
uniref:DUF4283 domain-containing protein n=1 Tax=Quercus lobata TaxID=97700 RepID=A0A7N2M0G4_QUELO